MATLTLPNIAPYEYLPAIRDMSTGLTTYIVNEQSAPETVEQVLGVSLYKPDGNWWESNAPLVSTIQKTKVATIPSILVGEAATTTANVLQLFEEYANGTVNFSGLLSAVSAKNVIGYIGAALGYTITQKAYEENPDLWDNVSKAVFGDTLRDKDIASPVLIKDGKTYFPEKMINRVKNELLKRAKDGDITTPHLPRDTKTYSISGLLAYNKFMSAVIERMNKLFDIDVTVSVADSMKDKYDAIVNNPNMVFRVQIEYNTTYKSVSRLSIDYMLPSNTFGAHEISYVDMYGNYFYINDFAVEAGNPISTLDKSSTFTFLPKSKNELVCEYIGDSYTESTDVSNIRYSGGQQTTDLSNGAYRYIATNIDATVDSIAGFTPTGKTPTLTESIADTYPEWKAKSVGYPARVGTDDKELWYPLTIPDAIPWTDGYTGTQEKAWEGELTGEKTATKDEVLDNTLPATITIPDTKTDVIVNPAPTPLPSIPSSVPSVSLGLAQLYNPTLSQLKEFSRWLWSVDLNIDQVKKLFADPMQAIIGLHAIYATPTESGAGTIQVGYINSGVTSQVVNEQFTTIDCGTVHIPETFGDVRDYSPYTNVNIYLPFIGIQELRADDVIGADVNVTYKVDVLTGSCIALISVKSKFVNGILYSYTGNCAIQLPISAGGYMQALTSLISGLGATIAGGAVGGIGGAVAGAASSIPKLQKTSVTVSGSLTGNAGAMGVKTPFITVRSPQIADAARFNEFYGYPANVYVSLSQLKGYTRIKDINLSVAGATEDELNEITALLKGGVIL